MPVETEIEPVKDGWVITFKNLPSASYIIIECPLDIEPTEEPPTNPSEESPDA